MNFKNLNKSYILIIAMLLIAGAVSWNLYFGVYRQKDTVSIHEFPRTIGKWASEDLPISDKEKAILETDNVFVRRYTNSVEGKEVYLFIVYSQNNRKVSHPPEVCYTGSGAAILSSVHNSFPSGINDEEIKVNHLTIEKRTFKQMFFYWFKVGDAFTSNYWKQQGLIALKSFLGQPASSALIRVSADIKGAGTDEDKAIADAKEFSQLILPYLKQYLP